MKIFTIGHSTHPIDYFIELLQSHELSLIADVRSIPASRYNPQFNKKSLSNTLELHRIAYQHFPEAFGAHITKPELLDEKGQVDFEKVRMSAEFSKGILQLKELVTQGERVALMCAEGDPLQCHRFGMICPALVENGFEVMHILKDKSLISNSDLEKALLKKYAKKLPVTGLFDEISEQEKIKMAYRLMNREIGFVP